MSAQVTFNGLMKALKAGPKPTDKPIKAALLADFASQHLGRALRAAALAEGIDLQLWEADYDAVDAAVANSSSELYSGGFRYVFLFFSSLKAYRQFSGKGDKASFAAGRLEDLRRLTEQIGSGTSARIIVSNYAEYDDGVFGNFANKTRASFIYQMRRLNMGIMELAAATDNLFVTDVQALQLHAGRTGTFDAKLYIHGDIIYSLDFMAMAAANTARIVGAAEGRFNKCVVIDLDNTMWGGIIGDDGMEKIELGELGIGKAFSALQYWLRNLKERGIILAVCSKNTEHIAKEPFEQHPGMVLRLDDISVFVANWETKVDNIRFIQSVLNIAYDSMVFLDDNPFERNIVRQYIPGINVPELPEDPALYLEYLQSLNLFEITSYTAADAGRTRQYQEESGRAALQKSFASESEFLQSLNMEAVAAPADRFSLPRVAQLTQRSNQFNLRTIRYTEADIAGMMNDGSYRTLTVNLSDAYGDYGLISAVILRLRDSPRDLFIDTWIMSCRVLKRGVEALVLSEIVRLAKEAEIATITGEYLPTAKNGIVADHYRALGFTAGDDGLWTLNISDYQPKEYFINITNHQHA